VAIPQNTLKIIHFIVLNQSIFSKNFQHIIRFMKYKQHIPVVFLIFIVSINGQHLYIMSSPQPIVNLYLFCGKHQTSLAHVFEGFSFMWNKHLEKHEFMLWWIKIVFFCLISSCIWHNIEQFIFFPFHCPSYIYNPIITTFLNACSTNNLCIRKEKADVEEI